MIDVPVAFAFAAGLVATINPCGFAMLPAYLSYFMGLDGSGDREGGGVRQALIVGGVVSAGFLTVFGVVGALVSAALRSIMDYVPWAALVIGIGLMVLGIAMLFFGYQPSITLPKLHAGGSSRRYRSVFAFGMSYAVASLSCTMPVFLTVVGAATASDNFLSGLLTFAVYGAGMSMLVLVLTVALGVAKAGMVRYLRAVLPYVGRVSGAILILAGGYITVFWAANLQDPFAARAAGFRSVERVQTWITDQLGSRPAFWAVALSAVLALAIAGVAWNRIRRQAPPAAPAEAVATAEHEEETSPVGAGSHR